LGCAPCAPAARPAGRRLRRIPRHFWNGALPIGLCALGASTALAAGWFGAALGRALAMWRDGAMTPFNVKSALVETLAGTLIAAPWATWGLSAAA